MASKDYIDRITKLFEDVQQNPSLYLSGVNDATGFILGSDAASFILGVVPQDKHEELYYRISGEKGWKRHQGAIWEQMTEAGLEEVSIIQELLSMELEVWKKLGSVGSNISIEETIQQQINKILELLKHSRDRPRMYFPGLDSMVANGFVSGVNIVCFRLGLATQQAHEEVYKKIISEFDYKWVSLPIWMQMSERGLSAEEINHQLLSIHITVWEKIAGIEVLNHGLSSAI